MGFSLLGLGMEYSSSSQHCYTSNLCEKVFLQTGSIHLLLQLLSEGWKSRVFSSASHMEHLWMLCNGSSSIMSSGALPSA